MKPGGVLRLLINLLPCADIAPRRCRRREEGREPHRPAAKAILGGCVNATAVLSILAPRIAVATGVRVVELEIVL